MNAVEKVGKLMVLPVGEQPTIATVVDPAKLKDQPFFSNAKVKNYFCLIKSSRKNV